MKVAVIGSRSFDDSDLLHKTLSKIEGITEIISGGAPGADRLGEQFADTTGIAKRIFYADWKNVNHPEAKIRINKWGVKYDAAAGFRRNKEIIENADLVVAFWDMKSPGTAHTLQIARQLRKKVTIVEIKKKEILFGRESL